LDGSFPRANGERSRSRDLFWNRTAHTVVASEQGVDAADVGLHVDGLVVSLSRDLVFERSFFVNFKYENRHSERLTAETLINHSGGTVMMAEAPAPLEIVGREDIVGWGTNVNVELHMA